MDVIREIERFQFPMDSSSTPYNTCEFSPEVEDICDAEKAFLTAIQDSTWQTAEAAAKQMNASRSRLRIAKCIVVGDISVGKTCLVHRLVEKTYANNLKATTGVDFEVQKYQILGRPFTLQIWDTAGHTRFQDITRTYYRGAHAVIICFDLSNFASFLKVKQWLDQVLETQQDDESLPHIFLVGTKLDLFLNQDSGDKTQLSNGNNNSSSYVNSNIKFPSKPIQLEHEARKVASQLGAEYWQISSQTGANVDELFDRIACLTFDRYMSAAAEQAKRDLESSKTIFYTKSQITNTKNSSAKNSNKSANNGSVITNGSDKKRKKQAPTAPGQLNGFARVGDQNSGPETPTSPSKRQRRSWMKQAIDLPREMIAKFTNCLSEQLTNRKSHKKATNKVDPMAKEYELEDRRLSQKSPISSPGSEKLRPKRKAFRCFNIKCTFAVEN